MSETLPADKGLACIALIGMRGSGKSVVGRELAVLLGGTCADTDDLVVAQAGKSIATIFLDEGEAGFRKRECEIIRQIVDAPPVVISVGGGAVLDPRNIAALQEVARVVWLTATPDVLARRISADPGTPESRPRLTDQSQSEEIKRLLSMRSALYEQVADVMVNTDHQTPKQIAQTILDRFGAGDSHLL